MTSERPRFPVGLSVAALVVFVICCALGVWQLQRAAWKTHQLMRITALKTAPPQPIGPVLANAAAGGDASFTRVSADCAAGSTPAAYHLTTDNADWIARARAFCRLTGGPYDGLLVDRGFLNGSRGATNVPGVLLPPPGHVVAACSTRSCPRRLQPPRRGRPATSSSPSARRHRRPA